MRLKVQNLEKQQDSLVRLIEFATEHGFIPMLNGDFSSPVIDEFVNLFTSSRNGTLLTRQKLGRLTQLTQTLVSLPVYTTEQAAAWLGVGIDRIREDVWKSDPPPLKTMKPGHDRLTTHGWLVQYRDNGG
jgi:hypothetical protein